MFAHLKIPLCYYDISCHNATHCHSSLSFECWCGFLMINVNSRNMQRWNDVMCMYWYVQVVGHMNWNCLANLNFSVDIKMFLYFMLINLYSSNKWICIFNIFCHLIYYFSVSNRYNIFFFGSSLWAFVASYRENYTLLYYNSECNNTFHICNNALIRRSETSFQ